MMSADTSSGNGAAPTLGADWLETLMDTRAVQGDSSDDAIAAFEEAVSSLTREAIRSYSVVEEGRSLGHGNTTDLIASVVYSRARGLLWLLEMLRGYRDFARGDGKDPDC